jgi:RNA polymerase primary sigma factor
MHRGDQARAEVLVRTRVCLAAHIREPRVRQALLPLRQLLSPELLQRAQESRARIPLGERSRGRRLTDSAVLRVAIDLARQKVDLRHRQTMDVEVRTILDTCLRIALYTDDTLVPLAQQRVASLREKRAWAERQLRVQAGEQARQTLRRANLLLVVSIARRGTYRWGDLSLLDRIQEGNLGLMKAVDDFDPVSYGTRFSTFAGPYIEQAIGRAVQNQSGVVRRPLHIHELVWRFRQNLCGLEDAQGHRLTAEEGMDRLHLSAHERATLHRGLRSEGQSSLFSTVSGDSSLAIADGHPCQKATEHLAARERVAFFRDRVRELLGVLTDREAAIVTMRLGLDGGEPMTQSAIGRIFVVTRACIQQTEVRAIHKLEEAAGVANGQSNASKTTGSGTAGPSTHGGYAALFQRVERQRR